MKKPPLLGIEKEDGAFGKMMNAFLFLFIFIVQKTTIKIS